MRRGRGICTVWLCVVLSAGALLSAEAQVDPVGPMIGTWEYRQKNPARPSGFDLEGERLVIRRGSRNRLAVDYFGLERAEEHGLFFTAVEATDVTQEPEGALRFTVPARRLFRTRPETVASAAQLESVGSSAYQMSLRAVVVANELVVSCTAGGGSCPEPVMTFRRAPLG